MQRKLVLGIAGLAAACSTARVEGSGAPPAPKPAPVRAAPLRKAPPATASRPVRVRRPGARARVATVPVGSRLAPFTARVLNLSGRKPRRVAFDSRRKAKVTAYMVVGTKCAATRAYAGRMRELAAAYRRRGVETVYVYPNRDDTQAAKIAFHRKEGFRGPLLDDRKAVLARRLGAQRTSTVVLVDRSGRIIYRGALDDSRDPRRVQHRWVAAALDQHLAHKPVAVDHSAVHA